MRGAGISQRTVAIVTKLWQGLCVIKEVGDVQGREEVGGSVTRG